MRQPVDSTCESSEKHLFNMFLSGSKQLDSLTSVYHVGFICSYISGITVMGKFCASD
jgi:hypothetical protein